MELESGAAPPLCFCSFVEPIYIAPLPWEIIMFLQNLKWLHCSKEAFKFVNPAVAGISQ